MTKNCLGLELAAVLEEYKKAGIEPNLQYTRAPQKPDKIGTTKPRIPRVIAIRGNTLIVSDFIDGQPSEREPV